MLMRQNILARSIRHFVSFVVAVWKKISILRLWFLLVYL